MKILVINGPSINLLGIREPEIYGNKSYEDLVRFVNEKANNLSLDVEVFQSNHEGDIIDKIQEAYFNKVDGLIINAGAYTHTSIAIADAIKGINIPCVEVHLSDVSKREPYRQISYIKEVAIATYSGYGFDSYALALTKLKEYLNK